MIRPMRESDLKAVCALEQSCFTSRWTSEQFRYELAENLFSRAVVMEEAGRIVAYLIYWVTFESGQLCKIAVDAAFRGKGYARELMEWMLRDAKERDCAFLTLEVRVSNAAAIRLYESFGFIQAGIRRAYYADNQEDAYVYACSIGGKEV